MMVEWLADFLKASIFSPAVFPAAFLLGLLGSITSCCNLPVLGAIAGYAGTFGNDHNRHALLLTALFFMLGTMAACAALGAVSGFFGQVAEASLGFYWRLFAGFIFILFALANLNLLPFNPARLGFMGDTWKKRSSVATIYGFAVGGGAAACSAFCNPILPVALAIATLQGQTFWSAAILTLFSVGYSLPLAGVLVGLGFGFGKLTSVVQQITPLIKTITGVLLLVIGFYLLAGL
jgi:cytochrome c biogenesis protein CcdA